VDSIVQGKTAADENFPVGSWLLPADLRPHVARFYAFARAADDIADSPTLAREEKLERLAAADRALEGAPPASPAEEAAARCAASLGERGVPVLYAHQLLQAFMHDARNDLTPTWSDLLAYCRYSAAPVGRFLVDLHGESKEAYVASDALCAALQILNHLQDIGDDWRLRHRVYLPQAWLNESGCSLAELGADRASPALRRVIDRVLDGVDALNATARPLPSLLRRRGFRTEAAVIVVIAERLARRLRRRDPLAGRVVLSPLARLGCVLAGGLRSLFR
jgi:squalene synthase HpnC